MKKYSIWFLIFVSSGLLTSCEAINTIFKAGMWWGIILVVGIIGVILWLFTKGKN